MHSLNFFKSNPGFGYKGTSSECETSSAAFFSGGGMEGRRKADSEVEEVELEVELEVKVKVEVEVDVELE